MNDLFQKLQIKIAEVNLNTEDHNEISTLITSIQRECNSPPVKPPAPGYNTGILLNQLKNMINVNRSNTTSNNKYLFTEAIEVYNKFRPFQQPPLPKVCLPTPPVSQYSTTTAPLENEIRKMCNDLADFLVEKNKAYGNSAIDPISIFANDVGKLTQIDVRIDDKLSRMSRGNEYRGEDTIKDLTGYLILRMIAVAMEKK